MTFFIQKLVFFVQLEEEYESKRQNEIETLQEAVEEKESQISQLHEQVHFCPLHCYMCKSCQLPCCFYH